MWQTWYKNILVSQSQNPFTGRGNVYIFFLVVIKYLFQAECKQPEWIYDKFSLFLLLWAIPHSSLFHFAYCNKTKKHTNRTVTLQTEWTIAIDKCIRRTVPSPWATWLSYLRSGGCVSQPSLKNTVRVTNKICCFQIDTIIIQKKLAIKPQDSIVGSCFIFRRALFFSFWWKKNINNCLECLFF